MDRLRIEGGHGLQGAVTISGAKNAALPQIAAALLSPHPLELASLPAVADVANMLRIIELHGAEIARGPHATTIDARNVRSGEVSYDIVRKMRASFLVLGPLLARFGEARVSLPGGCAIGARPVDLHLRAMAALGAAIELSEGYVVVRAPVGLRGGKIEFPFVSVGATENALMAASLAKGETVIHNAAREPEIVDLGMCLIAMGARISGLGTSRIVVEGVPSLHGATHSVLPDRIETGTYAMAAAICGGDIFLTGTSHELIGSLVPLLERAGTTVTPRADGIAVHRNGSQPIAADVSTEPFPGFPTDLQAQFMAVMSTAHGTAHIKESIFEN